MIQQLRMCLARSGGITPGWYEGDLDDLQSLDIVHEATISWSMG